MAESADAAASKAVVRKDVRVQVSLRAPIAIPSHFHPRFEVVRHRTLRCGATWPKPISLGAGNSRARGNVVTPVALRNFLPNPTQIVQTDQDSLVPETLMLPGLGSFNITKKMLTEPDVIMEMGSRCPRSLGQRGHGYVLGREAMSNRGIFQKDSLAPDGHRSSTDFPHRHCGHVRLGADQQPRRRPTVPATATAVAGRRRRPRRLRRRLRRQPRRRPRRRRPQPLHQATTRTLRRHAYLQEPGRGLGTAPSTTSSTARR